jgi:hypothetical protein
MLMMHAALTLTHATDKTAAMDADINNHSSKEVCKEADEQFDSEKYGGHSSKQPPTTMPTQTSNYTYTPGAASSDSVDEGYYESTSEEIMLGTSELSTGSSYDEVVSETDSDPE